MSKSWTQPITDDLTIEARTGPPHPTIHRNGGRSGVEPGQARQLIQAGTDEPPARDFNHQPAAPGLAVEEHYAGHLVIERDGADGAVHVGFDEAKAPIDTSAQEIRKPLAALAAPPAITDD